MSETEKNAIEVQPQPKYAATRRFASGNIYAVAHATNWQCLSRFIYLHQSSLIKIPNPRFIVFYNGDTKKAKRYKLRLSDAFEIKDASGDFEWTADVININQGANETLVKKCKSLYDYVRLVGRISDNKKSGMKIEQAAREAVDWAIKENFLEGFVHEQKEEIIAMCLTEYDEESCIRGWREDGRQEKAVEDTRNFLAMNVLSPEQIAQGTGLPLEQVLELQKQLAAEPAN